MYIVATLDLSQHLHIVALLLVLIASIVLICKSLWISVSAKWLNVNNTYTAVQKFGSASFIILSHTFIQQGSIKLIKSDIKDVLFIKESSKLYLILLD